MLSIPFVIAFRIDVSPGLEYAISALFFVDIIVTFNTGYVDPNSELLVFDRTLIASRYLKFWFWIDIVSTIPFDEIVANISSSSSSDIYSSTRLVRVVRLLRLVKLIRFMRLQKIFSILRNRDVNESVLSTLSLSTQILFLCHLVACFWFFLGSSDDNAVDGTWLLQFGFNAVPIFDQYVASLYWTITTLLTVGYGDITPVNTDERGYAIFAEICGGIVFGSVIAQVAKIVDQLDPIAKAMSDRMTELNSYLEEKPLPLSVKKAAKVNPPQSVLDGCC